MAASVPEVTTPGDLGDEVTSFLRSMRCENVSPNTIATYGTACRFFAEWMMERGNPTDMDAITARHVEDWELSLQERVGSATVNNRHRGLQRFFSSRGRPGRTSFRDVTAAETAQPLERVGRSSAVGVI